MCTLNFECSGHRELPTGCFRLFAPNILGDSKDQQMLFTHSIYDCRLSGRDTQTLPPVIRIKKELSPLTGGWDAKTSAGIRAIW